MTFNRVMHLTGNSDIAIVWRKGLLGLLASRPRLCPTRFMLRCVLLTNAARWPFQSILLWYEGHANKDPG